MAKNKKPGNSGRGASNGKYRAPLGLDYNEFVGPLGPPQGDSYPELHVRYGVRDDLYVDWAVTLQVRIGGIDQLGPGKPSLQRRRWQRLALEGSKVQMIKHDLDHPNRPAVGTVLHEFSAGEDRAVDAAYIAQIRMLYQSWVANYGEDPHTDVTFRYALQNHDPEFRNSESVSWVRNTVLSLHSDLADDVVTDRIATYFPGKTATAGVLLEDNVMKFIQAGQRTIREERASQLVESAEGEDGRIDARGPVTMGMLVDTIYGGRNLAQQVEDFLGDQ